MLGAGPVTTKNSPCFPRVYADIENVCHDQNTHPHQVLHVDLLAGTGEDDEILAGWAPFF